MWMNFIVLSSELLEIVKMYNLFGMEVEQKFVVKLPKRVCMAD